jgi:adenosine deaminase
LTRPVDAWDSHVHLESGIRLREQTGAPADQQPAAALEAALASFVAECATAAVGRADLRLSPVRWLKRGVAPHDLREALEGARSAASASGIALRFLATIKREFTDGEVAEAVEFAQAGTDDGVVGIDVSRSYAIEDAEARPAPSAPLSRLRTACAEARSSGLEIAVHCGGYDVEDDVWVAIDDLAATRIGHGLAIGRSKALIDRLAADRTTIEVCPTAAARQGVEPDRHPCRDWLLAGIPVSLGTDHPRALRTSLPEEARKLRTILRTTISHESTPLRT